MTRRFRLHEGHPYLTDEPAEGMEAGVSDGRAWVALTVGGRTVTGEEPDPTALAGRLEALAAYLKAHAGDTLADGTVIDGKAEPAGPKHTSAKSGRAKADKPSEPKGAVKDAPEKTDGSDDDWGTEF